MSGSFCLFLHRAVKIQTAFTLAVLGILLVFHLSLSAQTTASTGSIQGTVTDPSGALVGGAKVTINNKSTGRLITVTTTSAGAYTSGALTPGDYTIRIEAPGFKTTEIPVTVQVGVTASGNAKLQVGQASQVVEVQSSAIEVNTEQATIQGVLTTQQIENLPINGRNFLDLAQLEPGVQIQDGGTFDPTKTGFSSISFGGRFGRTARIEVDGLDISDETVGTTTQNVPEGAIQEFQIQQSSLDLSTELTSSGSVNVTTKSGTNGYHGEGYYNFRDQTLDAALPDGTTNYFQRNQYGGNFGGPIIKNKVFFFVDAERTKQDLLDPVLPSGAFSALTGSFDSPFREAEGLARLDWQITTNYKLFYRFSYDQNHSVQPYTANTFQPFGNVNHTPVQAVGLDFITGGFTHSIRFGYTKFRNGIVDAVAGSPIYDPLPGIELAIGADPDCLTAGADDFCSGPSFLAPQQTYQSDHQFKYDGSKAVGKHILRYGGGLNHIFGGGFASFLALGPAVSAGVADCNATCMALPGGASNPLNYPANTVQLGNGQGYDSEIPAFGFPAGGSGPDNRLSLYFGDAWKIRPGLTLTYGLRYVRDSGRSDSDLSGLPQPFDQNFDNQFYSNLGARVNQPNKNFAPQIGIAWDPTHSGKTVIRGGIGLFYENSIWNNIEFDRPARLPTGLFLATPDVCEGGSGGIFTLPNGATQDWSGICGQPIGSVASQILANQKQYQAATVSAGPASNPSYINNPNTLADGLNVTGTDLLYPKYVSPRSVQMNFGIQREIRKGMVVSADYLRNIETHTLLAIDTNHVGDARFFNLPAALAAINATVVPVGCGPVANASQSIAAVSCYITAVGSTAAKTAMPIFAGNGLDSGYFLCFGYPCSTVGEPNAAFPGINPAVGANQMLFPSGRAEYNGLQLSLKQDLHSPTRYVRAMNLQVSYALSRYVALATDNDFINIATDFNHPLRYLGPNGLDRKNQLSFGGSMDLPYKFRLGLIGHFYSPLPVTPTLSPSGNPGGIFVTDITGDGTGDGSFGSNGGYGDVLPGTGIGSFGRSVNASNINTAIQNYNNSIAAGVPTPAGQTLIQNGLFTQAQLVALGGVQQPVPLAPKNSPNMGWLHALDLSMNWIYEFRESIELQPGISFYNVMNFSNVDGPANPLSGVLSGAVGSINGPPNTNTSNEQQPSNRLGLGSGVFALGSPRALEFTLKLSF